MENLKRKKRNQGQMRDAWEIWYELENHTMVPLYTTPNSQYTILNGYKIEKTNDHRVTISNTRNDSAFYRRLGMREKFAFARYGFVDATHRLSIEHLCGRLNRLNEQMQELLNMNKESDIEKVRKQRREVVSKIRWHYNKIKS